MYRFIRIHFLNLLDGSPCYALPSNIIWEIPRTITGVSVEDFLITGSKLMLHAYYRETVRPTKRMGARIFVWDWRAGDLVKLLLLE